jgi:hypothetical protein
MFEDRQPIYYVKAKNGKMLASRGKGDSKETTEHDYVTGKVTGIKYGESTYNGEIIKSWRVSLQGESGAAILTLGYSSGFTRSFLNALLTADLRKPIKFGCYVKNEFNAPSLIQDNQILRWKYQEMPKTKKVMVGSKEVIDDSEAVKWTEGLVKEIENKLDGDLAAVATVFPEVAEDLPWETPPELT